MRIYMIGAGVIARPHAAAMLDVEHLIGAFPTFRPAAGRPIGVHYERGACTHGGRS